MDSSMQEFLGPPLKYSQKARSILLFGLFMSNFFKAGKARKALHIEKIRPVTGKGFP